jgi:SPP1 gp7 family putative phage head morphogenesis protein
MTKKQFSLTPQGGKLSETLIIEPLVRSNPDIRKWRYALRSAEDTDRPDRSKLYDIYEETLLDGMVTSTTERIVLKCTNSKIIFLKDGEADKEHPINKMLKTPVFLDILKWIIQSKWWGHSLIELDFNSEGISKATLLERKNVIPEKGLVVERVGEDKGTYYRQSPYIDYLLDVGAHKDLGLLNKATPCAIFKRFGISSWGEYVERFGIPIQEYQYDPLVPGSREEVIKQSKEQGSGAKIIMPSGTQTTLHKGADGSGSAVFKEYKTANEEDILYIFLLQTMTTKDGSSRSQSETHLDSETELIAGYKLFIEMVLNFQLKPILERHSFDVSNGNFEYETSDGLTKEQLVNILTQLAAFGDIPLDLIEKLFGIKLEPKTQEPVPTDKPTEKPPVKNSLGGKKKNKYELTCCAHHLEIERFVLSESEEEALLKRVFDQGGNLKFDPKYFNQLAQNLLDGLNGGWEEKKGIDYNSPDYLTRTMLELNLYRFSATKDLALLQEVNDLIPDSDTFADFEKKAAKILTTYNKNYLLTEFNLAHATALSTSNYLHNLEVKDEFPYWKYVTVGDDRVRPEHEALDGMIFLAGEMGAFTSPNGYGCRCEQVPVDSTGGKEVSTEADAIAAVGDKVYDKMKKDGFDINRAEENLVFTENQMYIPRFAESSLNFNDFNLKNYDDIAAKAAQAETTKRTQKQAKDWFSKQVGKNDLNDAEVIRFIDFNKKPTLLEQKTMLANKNWDILDLVPDALDSPNEVYFERLKGGGYKLRYIKHFNPKPLVVELVVNKKNSVIQSFGFASDIAEARTGLLIMKK